MSNRQKLSLCIAVLSVAFSTKPMLAAENNGFAISSLPKGEATIEKFCPPHWKFEQKIPANLNADASMDLIAVLISDPAKHKADEPDTQNRVLLALLGGPNKTYQLADYSTSLLLCTTCGGQLGANIDLQAGKGSFKLDQSGGGGVDDFDCNYEIKYDGQAKQCYVSHAELTNETDRNGHVGTTLTLDPIKGTGTKNKYNGDHEHKTPIKFAPKSIYIRTLDVGKNDVDKQLKIKQ